MNENEREGCEKVKDLTREELLMIRSGLQALIRGEVGRTPIHGKTIEQIKATHAKVLTEIRTRKAEDEPTRLSPLVLTPVEARVLDLLLWTNPCESGCAFEEMQRTVIDCSDCALIKAMETLREKLQGEESKR